LRDIESQVAGKALDRAGAVHAHHCFAHRSAPVW
jgi:hypothetical protein